MRKVSLFTLCIIIISSIFYGCSSDKNVSKDVKVLEDSYKSGSTDENVTGDVKVLGDSYESESTDEKVTEDIKVLENSYKSGSTDETYVELKKINDDIWVHISYSNYNGNRTSSNGLVAISSMGLILVDTPWTNQQTKELLELTKSVFNKDVKLAVITHAHADRIGGIDTLIENNVDIRSTSLTVTEAEKAGIMIPQSKLDSEPQITIGDFILETYYPGEGHSPDNIVVWFPQYKVLFGGCLIKSMGSSDLGSTTDANVQQWPVSVKKVIEKYSDAKTVMPGHGEWGDLDLLKHTLELVKGK